VACEHGLEFPYIFRPVVVFSMYQYQFDINIKEINSAIFLVTCYFLDLKEKYLFVFKTVLQYKSTNIINKPTVYYLCMVYINGSDYVALNYRILYKVKGKFVPVLN
jgi:hypothetical protein